MVVVVRVEVEARVAVEQEVELHLLLGQTERMAWGVVQEVAVMVVALLIRVEAEYLLFGIFRLA